MKKLLPYLLLVLLVIAAGVFLFSKNSEKEFNDRVTYNKNSKLPYGYSILYNTLPQLFKNAKVEVNKKSTYSWFYNTNNDEAGSLLMIVVPDFKPDEQELILLERFVKKGNYVFIVSPRVNEKTEEFFDFKQYKHYYAQYNENRSGNLDLDTVSLLQPPFSKDTTFANPGLSYKSYFRNVSRDKFVVVGKDKETNINFIKANVGDGSFYFNSNPFLFANYFLLKNTNIQYAENSFALVPNKVKKIIWDEYYLYKENDNQDKKEPSPLRVLLKHPSFFWSFWVSVALIAIYLLVHSKRSQRYIPIINKPKNESLDFIQTIGKLYFEKQDHVNLSNKMVIYFLDHVRSKYFINTSVLNKDFVEKLTGKSGYPEDKIKQLLHSISEIQSSTNISQNQLANYYQQFKNFYKNTA